MSKNNYLDKKLPRVIYPVVIELLASYASDIVLCKSNEYEKSKVSLQPLTQFIQHVLDKSGINNVLEILTTIIYMKRLKSKLSPISTGLSCTRHRIFLATLIISQKYTQDVPYRNLDWSYITPFSLEDINLMERQLLYKLNYDLNFSEAEVANLYFYTLSKIINNISLNYTYSSFPNIESIYNDPSICIVDTTSSDIYKKDISDDSILSEHDYANIELNYNNNSCYEHQNINVNNNINRNKKIHVILSNDMHPNITDNKKNMNKNNKKHNTLEMNAYKNNYHESRDKQKVDYIPINQNQSSNINMLNNLNVNENNIIKNLKNYPKDKTTINNKNNKNTTDTTINKNNNNNNINNNKSSNIASKISLNNISTKNKNININLIKNHRNNNINNNQRNNVNINKNSDNKNNYCNKNENENGNINLNPILCYNVLQTSDSSDDEYFFEKYENMSYKNKNIYANYYDCNVMKNNNQIPSNNINNNVINTANLNSNTTKSYNTNIDTCYYQHIMNQSTTSPTKSSVNIGDKKYNINMIDNNIHDISLSNNLDNFKNMNANRNTYNNKNIILCNNSANYNYNNYNYNSCVGNNTSIMKTENIHFINTNEDTVNSKTCKNNSNFNYSQLNQYSYNQFSSNDNSRLMINNENNNDDCENNKINSNNSSSSIFSSYEKNEHRIYPCNENSILSDFTKAFSSIKLSTSSSSSSLYSSSTSSLCSVNQQRSNKENITSIPSFNTAFSKVENNFLSPNNKERKNFNVALNGDNSGNNLSKINKNSNYYNPAIMTILNDTKKIDNNSTFCSNCYKSSNSINNTSNSGNENENFIDIQNYNCSEFSDKIESFHDENKQQYKMDENEILYGDIFYSDGKNINETNQNMNKSHFDIYNNNNIENYNINDDDIDIKCSDSDSLYYTESENYFSQDEKCESISSQFRFDSIKDKKLDEDKLNLNHGFNDSENFFSQKSDIVFNEISIAERITDNQKFNITLDKNETIIMVDDNNDRKSEEKQAINSNTNKLSNKKKKMFKLCSSSLSPLSENNINNQNIKHKNNLYKKTENKIEEIKNDSLLYNKYIKKDNNNSNNNNNNNNNNSILKKSEYKTSKYDNIKNVKKPIITSKIKNIDSSDNTKGKKEDTKKQKSSTIKVETSFLSKVINDTIHEINSHKHNINNISTFTSLFASSRSKSTNKTEIKSSTFIPTIKVENSSKISNNQNQCNENNVIESNSLTLVNENLNSTNDSDNNIPTTSFNDNNLTSLKNNKNINGNNISVNNNNLNININTNFINDNDIKKNKNKNVDNLFTTNNENNKSNNENLQNPFLASSHMHSSSSSLKSDDNQNNLNQCKTVFEYINIKEKKLKMNMKQNKNEKNNTIGDKNILSNTLSDDNISNFDRGQSIEYENSYLNDTPSITSKIQRLDDMLEYCSLKHNVIINSSSSLHRNDELFHSIINNNKINDEKSCYNNLQNNKTTSSTSDSLNNFSSLNKNSLDNNHSQNFHSINQKVFMNNTSNITLISDGEDNMQSNPHLKFTLSENFNSKKKDLTSDSMIKYSIYLNQESEDSSHTIHQDKEDDIQCYSQNPNSYIYGQNSSNSSQFSINNSNNINSDSNSHIGQYNQSSISSNKSYKINFSYDTENNYQSMNYTKGNYFYNSENNNFITTTNQYLHPNYMFSNNEVFYRNSNYQPQNSIDPYIINYYNNKSTESFINSATSSMYNSSVSSPMNMKNSHNNLKPNIPINSTSGLHKSQRIENLQYYNSSSESVNNY
ncbi:hypothetical protein BCR36DRAFT_413675 [Piromyces finnis]|uniref:Cyclin N-terminal domain-containing protein n=1 Tax=Piromyces finnis TaxID=1754191 RepID=A0A1Y1V637_9FUNG|nr:hypothetical protein BCR36DRAFT_413675 [Piromyces finnis]|eukprot:ORX47323.1 hypothetical protein BCR36DRAFT_413675 [Piromyces finnis]